VFDQEGDVEEGGRVFKIDYVPWNVEITGCCRFSDQANNPDSKFMISTAITLAKAPASPDSRTLPEVTLVSMSMAPNNTFTVSAPVPFLNPASVTPGKVTWQWCPAAVWTYPSWAAGTVLPSLSEQTGVVTWPSGVDTKGVYHLCVRVSTWASDEEQKVFSDVDFRVRVLPAGTRVPIIQLSSYGVSGGGFNSNAVIFTPTYIGFATNIQFSALSPNISQALAISAGYKDSGVTYSSSQGSAVSISLVYAPRSGYQGWAAVCFAAAIEGTHIASAQACVNVNNSADGQPVLTAFNQEFQASGSLFRVREGQNLDVTLRGCKPVEGENITISQTNTVEGGNPLVPLTVGSNSSSLFRYVAPRSRAGSVVQACFRAEGAPDPETGSPGVSDVCIDVEIERCVWTVRGSESLLSISQELGVSWLQLWNYNKGSLRRPDLDLEQGSAVKVGQLYQVQLGDSLYNVAQRFSTTVGKLVAMNADLSESTQLDVGQHLCVTFDSCSHNVV